jgi:uncharacterized repeat protein (TIGR01451 family)
MSDFHGHRDRSGDWRWEPRAKTAVSAFSRSPVAWLVAAAALFVFAWMVAGNGLSFDSASLDSYCGRTAEGDVQAETWDCNPCADAAAGDVSAQTWDCDPCAGVSAATGDHDCDPCPDTVTGQHGSYYPTKTPKECDTPTPPVETPTPPVETATPPVICDKSTSNVLKDPTVPDSSDKYKYEVDGCGIKYVKFMGCWEKDDIDRVETSAGSVVILDDGKIRVEDLDDGDFPLTVTIVFTSDFPSGSLSVNTWLWMGPGDSDGETIWVDGPICDVIKTETPTPPVETPTPPVETPTPPVETPTPPVETPTPPVETPTPPVETPTPPVETPTPTIPVTATPTDTPTPTPTDTPPPVCEKDPSVELTDPTVPNGGTEFSYTVDGCGIEYVKFMGCWEKDDIDHVETSAGTVVIFDDGKIRVEDLDDSDFPVDITIVFKHAFPSGTQSVNVWLFQGPDHDDGHSIWVDGPICDVEETPTPTPPVETPTPTPTTPPPPETDLTIVKTDQPDPVAPGGTLAYSITVTNISDVDAENVVMTDSLPAGVTLISATPSQGTCTGATCNLGTIPARQAAAISVVVMLDPGAPALLTNLACVATSTTESNLSNNCDDEETKVPTPTPLGATQTPKPPANFPQTGGAIPGAESTGGQLAIAAALALLAIGLAAAIASRRKASDEA